MTLGSDGFKGSISGEFEGGNASNTSDKKVLKKYVISFKIATDNESDSYYDMIYEIATRIINT